MTTYSIDDAAWGSPWRRRRVGEKVLLSLALVLTALLTPPWPGCVAVALFSVFLILGPARSLCNFIQQTARRDPDDGSINCMVPWGPAPRMWMISACLRALEACCSF